MSKLQEDSWRAGNEMNTLLPAPSAGNLLLITVIGGREDYMVCHGSTDATVNQLKQDKSNLY